MGEQQEAFDVLAVGLGAGLQEQFLAAIQPLAVRQIVTPSDFEQLLENCQIKPDTYVFVSTAIEGVSHLEVAQAMNSSFQGLHLVFLTAERGTFELEALKKNGFTEALLLPLDAGVFKELTDEAKAKRLGGGFRKFKAIKIVDIQPGEDLPFAIRAYLPNNNKYVLLTGSGQLSDKKYKLLKERNANSVFVESHEIEKFYEFTAERMIKLGSASNDGVSQTEKSARLQASVRELFRSVLTSGDGTDFQKGRDLLEQSQKVVASYLQKKTGLDLRAKLGELVGDISDAYSHAQSVSTVASLLSMATGIGKPEDLAIAGLFHDLGKEGLPPEVTIFDRDKLSENDVKVFLQHPLRSLNLLREKKFSVPTEVAEMIEKHHERVDGKGFPAGIPAHRIPKEAHIVAYADAFVHLMVPKPGQSIPTPEAAHARIASELGLIHEVVAQIGKFIGSVSVQAN